MPDPSLAIQGAVFAALNTTPAVAGGRIYDSIPASASFPYVTIGDSDTAGDDNECFDASEVNIQVHVWSRAQGMPEAKQIASTIRDRLVTQFSISGFKVTNAEHVLTLSRRDPDGLTSHVIVEFRYLVDHDT